MAFIEWVIKISLIRKVAMVSFFVKKSYSWLAREDSSKLKTLPIYLYVAWPQGPHHKHWPKACKEDSIMVESSLLRLSSRPYGMLS